MRAHYLQHVPFEGLGYIETWLQEKQATITCTRFDQGGELPEVDDLDLLVVMGGPMSVNDEDEFPWLVKEKRFIRECIEKGKAVLGVCLGAQLIASAMGARVFKNPQKEIGWFPINAVKNDSTEAFKFANELTVFHWHGDASELPVGAVHLAKSPACENQAFQIGKRTIGLQFHTEVTAESLKAMCDNLKHELIPNTYVKTAQEIRQVSEVKLQEMHQLTGDILTYLIF
jgi:GMP synthase-like glutamine amidotransferase